MGNLISKIKLKYMFIEDQVSREDLFILATVISLALLAIFQGYYDSCLISETKPILTDVCNDPNRWFT
jgi:hypothetical protein